MKSIDEQMVLADDLMNEGKKKQVAHTFEAEE